MDVPDMKLYGTTRLSWGTPVTVVASDHAARMSTPGAVRSGCNKWKQESYQGCFDMSLSGL